MSAKPDLSQMSVSLHINTASVVLTSCTLNVKFSGTRGTEKEHKKKKKEVIQNHENFVLFMFVYSKTNGGEGVKINAKDWKIYSYIHIHKYMVAVYSRKIL